MWIRNSFAPERPGTQITAGRQIQCGGVKALTAIRDVTLVTVGGPGIVGLTDVLARSFAATAALRTNVLFVSQSSSQNDICFVIPSDDEKRTVAAHCASVRTGNCRANGGTCLRQFEHRRSWP